MVWVPLDCVDSQVVILESFLVLARVCFRAQMDHAFFGTHQEKMFFEWVEVKAHTACKTVQKCFFLAFCSIFFGVLDQHELDNFLSLKFILQQVPVCDATIRRD